MDASQESIREYRILGGSSWGRHWERRLKARRFFCSRSNDHINRLAASLQRRSLSRLNPAHLLQSMIKSNPEMHWSMRRW
ncbi:MAG: hypothetical protein LUQ02_00485 [Methanothrix sp.]|nr:hypothetical protein [Methanothrix sp.]